MDKIAKIKGRIGRIKVAVALIAILVLVLLVRFAASQYYLVCANGNAGGLPAHKENLREVYSP